MRATQPATFRPLPLPPTTLPPATATNPVACIVRDLRLSEEPEAFLLSEIAFLNAVSPNPADDRQRQIRWNTVMRSWFAWLHREAHGQSYAASPPDGSVLGGYARVIRDIQSKTEMLTELFVRPEFQHAHIGSGLLRTALTPAVPPGWRRIIISHPEIIPLAMYQRWGCFPLGEALHCTFDSTSIDPALLLPDIANLAGPHAIQPLTMQDSEQLTRLDMSIYPYDRTSLHAFLFHHLHAHGLIVKQGERILGYSYRTPLGIGPIYGETESITLALLLAQLVEAVVVNDPHLGCWIPGINVAVQRGLLERALRYHVTGHVVITASTPDIYLNLSRSILTLPLFVL